MSAIMESFEFVCKLIKDYGSEFKGIYFAMIITLAVIVICNLKNKGIRSFVIYNVVVLGLLLVLSFLDYSFEFAQEKDFEGIYIVFPTILSILLGFSIISPYMLRNVPKEKKNLSYVVLVVATTIVFLVEASVPFQWTFENFSTSKLSNKYSDEVMEMANTIGTHSAMLPEKYKISVKEYNNDANILEDESSDYVETSEEVFIPGYNVKVDYIIVKNKDFVGKKEEDKIYAIAAKYKYTLVKQVGDYLIYGSPNVVGL